MAGWIVFDPDDLESLTKLGAKISTQFGEIRAALPRPEIKHPEFCIGDPLGRFDIAMTKLGSIASEAGEVATEVADAEAAGREWGHGGG